MPETEITIGPEAKPSASAPPKVKPAPKPAKLPLKFAYFASADGVDENLLVMLHGLGDTEAPFANLGKQLRLPQTAVLSLRAPSQIPYLEEDAFQWYESFDRFGDLLTQPNPTPALVLMDRVLDHLISDCLWPSDRIHLFGFAQGGSVAAELPLRRHKASPPSIESESSTDGEPSPRLPPASIVSIEGPLISYPTSKSLCPVPILYFHRTSSSSNPALAAMKKGFKHVNDIKFPSTQQGMPRGKTEWAPVMEFWSRMLSSRMPDVDGLHPVLSGGPALPTGPSSTS